MNAGTDWLLDHWLYLTTGGGGLSLLAALPRVGKHVRWFLLAVLRSLPPLAELRVQSHRERADMERERALRYRAELDELTTELARLRSELASRRDSGGGGAPSSTATNRRRRTSDPIRS